jgi:hypothetical protein
MNGHLIQLALAGAAIGACVGAQAVTVDEGLHGAAFVASMTPSAGSYFDDFFTFTIPAGGGMLGATAVANNLNVGGTDVYLLVGGSFGLYSNPDGIVGNGDDVAIGPGLLAFDGTTGDLSNVNQVAAGRYYYEVTGLAFGSAGAAYQLTSGLVTAPVPEPQTLGLMLAGLAALGFMSHRRAKATTR